MSTHSNIIVERSDGSAKKVYVHFDGYPSGIGRTLVEHYTTQEQAEAVVLGDISSLGPRCDGCPGHSYETKVPGQTVYYGRDRGEEDVDGEVFPSLKEALLNISEYYAYVWTQGEWRFGRDLTSMSEAED
jgi:hypothetical protein